MAKNASANAGDTKNPVDPWIRDRKWNRKWQPIPVFLPGKFHGQRRLAGYSPEGHKESDTTEYSTHTMILFSRSKSHLGIKKSS